MRAGAGDDKIGLGSGRDVVRAGAGDDVIYAADGQRDIIICGPGKDKVKADRKDRVARDCERLVRVSVKD